jgi:hypothetical protein
MIQWATMMSDHPLSDRAAQRSRFFAVSTNSFFLLGCIETFELKQAGTVIICIAFLS